MRWLCILLAAALLCAETPKSKPVDLSLSDIDGKRVRLKDLRGKIVVLNFWATWCGPCKEELPLLVEAEQEYRGKGVVFVAASLDEKKTQERIPAFLKEHGVTFAVWTGASADDLDKLRMGEAVPATAFLDQEGRIVARVSGEIRIEELKERLDWLLGGQSGKAPEPFVKHLDK